MKRIGFSKSVSTYPKLGYGGEFLSGGLGAAGMGAQVGTAIAPGIGTAIGAGVGFLAGGISDTLLSKKRDKMISDQELQAEEFRNQVLREMKIGQDRLAVASYNPNGNGSFRPYGKFGTRLMSKLNPTLAQGGNLLPIAEDAQYVDGASHEEGGVTLAAPGMQTTEVEGGEVVVDDMVFSKRLQHPSGLTFADVASVLVQQPEYKTYKNQHEKAEIMMGSEDHFKSNEGKAMLDKLVNPLEMLFQLQKSFAPQDAQANYPVEETANTLDGAAAPAMGAYGTKIKKLAWGGITSDSYTGEEEDPINPLKLKTAKLSTLSPYSLSKQTPALLKEEAAKQNKNMEIMDNTYSIMAAVTPFIDNLKNKSLLLKTPKPNKPILPDFIPLETKYDNNAALKAIDDAVTAGSKGLSESTMGGGAAATRKQALVVAGMKAKNEELGKKFNIEQDLRNKNNLRRQEYTASTANAANAYNETTNSWIQSILSNDSANTANMQQDIQQMIVDGRLDLNDKKVLQMLKKRYQDSGVYERNMPDWLKNALKQYED